MKTVTKILKWAFALVALLYVIGFLIPNKVHVERSIVINAKADNVRGLIADFKNWRKWSPWDALDPHMKKEFINDGVGVGSGYTWESHNKNVGKGRMSMLEVTPSLIKQKLEFDGMGSSYPSFVIAEAGENTTVTWIMDSSGEGVPFLFRPMSNWFAPFMDKMIGPDFEKGLKNMKEVAEAMPKS